MRLDAADTAVFSCSASQALAAKQARDGPALEASGLPVLEAAITDFLIRDRRRLFLAGMCDRIAALADTAEGDAIRDRLAALRQRIETGAAVTAAPSSATTIDAALPPLLADCELCARITDAMFNFFAAYQVRLYASPEARGDLAARGGLCRLHARQFEAIAASREAATAFAPVLTRQADALRRIAAAGPAPAVAGNMVADQLPGGATCPACAIARQAQAEAVRSMAELVMRAGADAPHDRSAVCLPHLGRLVAAIPDPARGRAVLVRGAALLERIAEDASRFAMKQDAIRRDIVSKEEYAAAARAARVLLEHPNAQYERAAPVDRRELSPDFSAQGKESPRNRP